MDAFPLESGQQVAQGGIVHFVRIDGGGRQAFPVDTAADMALHQLGKPLQQGFFRAVACGRAVEFPQQLEPVQRQPDSVAVSQMCGRKEMPAQGAHGFAGLFRGKAVLHGAADLLDGQQVLAEAIFGLGPGGADHMRQALPETEKGKAFHQLHQGGGTGLFRRGAFAHLLAGGHDAAGVPAADTEVDRDAQTAHVHAADFGQDVQAGGLHAGLDAFIGLLGRDGLVQVAGIALGAGLQTNDRKSGRAHGYCLRSRICRT